MTFILFVEGLSTIFLAKFSAEEVFDGDDGRPGPRATGRKLPPQRGQLADEPGRAVGRGRREAEAPAGRGPRHPEGQGVESALLPGVPLRRGIHVAGRGT